MHDLSAIELAAAIARGETSSREALTHFVERVDRLDRPINAVVTRDLDAAYAAADAADAAVRAGAPLGPLHGVPMTVKDSLSTKGLRTTSGAPELADHVPTEDAWPVAAMRRAGAVIWAKTNLPIYAGDMQSYNEVFGTTNNPWDLERTPGGSSGGSGAALTARFTPLEIGSDIGGSIRLPAHMSGVYGHKPSYGIVPAHGQIPGPPGSLTLADLAVAGPMARTVADLDLALGLMSGPNRWEGPAWRLELPEPRHTELGRFRVAAWFDDDACPLDPEVAAVLHGMADRLDGAGCAVDRAARPGFTLEKVVERFFALLNAALAGGTDPNTLEEYARATGDNPIALTKRQTAMRHRQWLSNNESRLQMRLKFERFFESFDILLLPVMPCVAIRHDHSEPMAGRTVTTEAGPRNYWELNRWMAPAGACYLPATVIPVGMAASGLPVGVQIVGPYLHDRTALAFAAAVAELVGPCPTPPGFA
ncbi:MAG: amidase [Acidimicrobiales bacterium]|nr:amidase [Acidimicrobiales bacterium]